MKYVAAVSIVLACGAFGALCGHVYGLIGLIPAVIVGVGGGVVAGHIVADY